MSNIKLSIAASILTLFSISCNNAVNSSTTKVFGSQWKKDDSLKFYFPQSNNPDSGFLKNNIDDFREKWYSSALFSFKEPILYDKNLETNAYRFLWLRSFHRPVVFTLIKSESKVILTSKILDCQPEFLEHKYDPRGWVGLEEELKGKTIERFGDSLIVVKADRKANIVYNSTKELTVNNWDNFENTLQKANFWTTPSNKDDERGNDGSEWIIEGLNKNKYWFVARWSPRNNDFQNAGILLIKLSGLKEEIY